MAAKGKARTIVVRLISSAGTGFFYTTTRRRALGFKLSLMKHDPVASKEERRCREAAAGSARKQLEDGACLESLLATFLHYRAKYLTSPAFSIKILMPLETGYCCTIDPEEARVEVPDPRIDVLYKLYNSSKK
ncbi:hypothetical protein CcCBS67573_g03456, partial [Chytriomyces confervae]